MAIRLAVTVRLACLVALVLGGAGMAATPAGAAAMGSSPLTALPLDILTSDSCTLPAACEAVGGSNTLTLAEGWHRSAASVQATPNPAGASASGLTGVSCPLATACTAVGLSRTGTTIVTLAEAWNGTTWSIQATPNPPGATQSQLTGVSCVSRGACAAVGRSATGAGLITPLAEVWNGTTWAFQAPPLPAGSTGGWLAGVSCVSAADCVAVGHYVNSSGVVSALAEVWNGTTWTDQTPPNPGPEGTSLAGVSCLSAVACTAVGSYVKLSQIHVFAEVWNGTAWAVQHAPSVAGATGNSLIAVSCTAVSACVAVGFYSLPGATEFALAEVWNGTAWKIRLPRNPTGSTDSGLAGVSCAGANACTAAGFTVGSAGRDTLAEVWNGTAWRIMATPSPAG